MTPVEWLEQGYDQPHAFRSRTHECHPGLFMLKLDHRCRDTCTWWHEAFDAWRWTP